MMDGSLIQERDPLTVPSTRRNPVLADVLNRLGYMERKGSGLEKIISGYEFQINYDDTKKPIFRSDRYQFNSKKQQDKHRKDGYDFRREF